MAASSDADAGNYILLPARGLRARRPIEFDFLTRFGGIRSTNPAINISTGDFFGPIQDKFDQLGIGGAVGRSDSGRGGLGDGSGGGMQERGDAGVGTSFDHAAENVVQVIDSVHEDGPKLVRMSARIASALERADVGFRAVPIRYYEPAQSLEQPPASPSPHAAKAPVTALTVVSAATGRPISGVKVVAFTSLKNDQGDAGVTDAAGRVVMHLGGSPAQLDSLFVETPASGNWGLHRTNVSVSNGDVIALAPIAAPYVDAIRQCCSPLSANDGQSVRVGVIDSGIGPHPDLNVVGGRNTVQGEPRLDWLDNGLGHGTHVAGIIGGRPQSGAPFGLAPSAELWSGRVYGGGANRATNYSIMKAMVLATDERCDLLNLSLVTSTYDQVLQDAITDAASVGSVVFAATGNEGSPTVSFPASCKDAVGISAFGVAGTYPIDTPHDAEIGAPRLGSDFFAAFSNYGTEVRFIGPGVGIISTAPGGGYSVRSGTSMACAAATGLSARLLAGDSALLNSPRNDARSAAIQNMLQAHAVSLGFGFLYEGAGRL